jgi:hypothetical protein
MRAISHFVGGRHAGDALKSRAWPPPTTSVEEHPVRRLLYRCSQGRREGRFSPRTQAQRSEPFRRETTGPTAVQ